MKSLPNNHAGVPSSSRRLSRVMGVTVAVVGAAVLMGWALDLETLKRVFPGLVSMKPNTAVAFLLAGVALRLFTPEAPNSAARVVGICCAVVTVAIGALTVGEYAFGWDLGIDEFLFKDDEAGFPGSSPGRMPLSTAATLSVLGAALLVSAWEGTRRFAAAQAVALVGAINPLIALVGYAYGVQSLYGAEGSRFFAMALHSAVTFLVLSVGIVSASPRGVMGMILRDGPGADMLRRLLPAILIIPSLLAILRLEGEQAGLYDPAFGVALTTVSSSVLLIVVVTLNARSLERSEEERRQAEEQLDRLRIARFSQKQALELNDDVVQGLVVAKWALDLGDGKKAGEAVDHTLKAARSIVSDLLSSATEDKDIEAGDLTRSKPALGSRSG